MSETEGRDFRIKDHPTIMVLWELEDDLPKLNKTEYDLMFPLSKVDIVRMFPYIEICGFRYYLREKSEVI